MGKNAETYTDLIIKELATFFDTNYPATVTFKRGRKKTKDQGSRLYSSMLQFHWDSILEEKKKDMLAKMVMRGFDERDIK